MLVSSTDPLRAHYDACIVGAGPAGIACALGCQQQGLRTILLEAGGVRPVPGKPDILAADILEPHWHDPPELIGASALGGTSHWWGGRSVPLDPVDFRAWPISYQELRPWYDAAAKFLGAKAILTSSAPGAFSKLTRFEATQSETFCPEINMAKRWSAALRGPKSPVTITNARATRLIFDAGRINGVCVRMGAAEHVVQADQFVLACGGLGVLRLLLLTQRDIPALFGGENGPLGVGYMGHLTGTIADLEPTRPIDADAFAFHPLAGSLYARRRITPREETVVRENLANVAFWLDNAISDDPAHGSSVASARFLFARLVRRAASLGRSHNRADLRPHFENIARAPVSAATGLMRTLYLFASARLTGRLPRPRNLTPASRGAWTMRYHAEQRPSPENKVRLSDDSIDSIGLPRLSISFRFGAGDCEAVVRAHELLDADLQESGAGRLRWHGERDACLTFVSDFARDGYHQLGGAAMNADPAQGVVDKDCRVHDISNLWIASSCVFPSGGQANPTLTIVALARRLADRLGEGRKSRRKR